MRDQGRRWTGAPDTYKMAQLERLIEVERHDTEVGDISSQASKKESGETSAPLGNALIDGRVAERAYRSVLGGVSPVSPLGKRHRPPKRKGQAGMSKDQRASANN